MRRFALAIVLLAACGDDDSAAPGAGGGKDAGLIGPNDPPPTKGDGGTLPTDPGTVPPPAPTCTPPATASDVSAPATTLGANGIACDEAALQAAIDEGGVITFSCGGSAAAPFVLKLTKELSAVDKDIVIDGGGAVTLSGDKATRILHIGRADNFEKPTPKVVVQKLNLVDGHTTDVAATKDTKKGGAAIYRLGGTLTVIDSKFLNNVGPTDGQDVAGGAIYSVGGATTTITGSSFSGNTCSNGGAIGNLGVGGFTLANSSFENNSATGQNANPGNGGNGGAISFDGPAAKASVPIVLAVCGTVFKKNSAGNKAFGGAIFRTVDTVAGIAEKTAPVTIDQSTFDGNESGSAGALYMHQADLTITASTFSNNLARAGAAGAIWAEGSTEGPANVTLTLTNVTVASNKAVEALGGGFFIGSNVTGGEFLHVTVAANEVTTVESPYKVFGAGLVGDVSKVKLTNSIFANNKKPAPESNDSANCQNGFIDGGGNIEFIKDHPDPKRCVAGSALVDPNLASLADNTGPTQTIALNPGSPAIGKGTAHCAATDQRGKARATPCAAGAFEP